ncbi:MAG: aminopeptidase [Lachnospiraceae bacterium]|nr:aminopeptidase [Lachnospiraceae bacterium]
MKAEELIYKNENIAVKCPMDLIKAMDFCEGYKLFLNRAKTERETVIEIISQAEKEGYEEFSREKKYKAGSKLFFNSRGKDAILVTIGHEDLSRGVRFNIAHIDCPRLDLKPNPLYEQDETALFKTHYYGGIRKYQWTAVPLAIHGTVVLRSGEKKAISIGEADADPKFFISDLLPHLSKKQDERTLKDGIKGEELNVIVGSTPYKDTDEKEPYRLMVLSILNDMFGMTEKDFLRAEIEVVPAAKASDIGFDRALVGAYGQDDRVCAYTAMMAAFEASDPRYTTVTVFTDKEEIGSYGNTGMDSLYLDHFLSDLCESQGAVKRDLYRNSFCVSSDVGAAYDPTFSDVFEKNNVPYLGHGPIITKYTGARGKGGASDASAETMARVISILDDNGVCWQTGELGKVDEGGGGTIAHYIASHDVDTVDVGVPVLAMHAPFELTSKLDVYHTYLAFKAVLLS